MNAGRTGGWSTRARLVATLSTLLLMMVAALALQLVSLRRMDATFAAMAEHDHQMRLALQLEDAVRAQYRLEGAIVSGEVVGTAEYEQARSRTALVAQSLGERPLDRESASRLHAAQQAIAEMHVTFRDQVAPAVGKRAPAAWASYERSFGLISVVEDNVDALFAGLQRSASASRLELAALERKTFAWTAALLVLAPVVVAGSFLYLLLSVASPLARLSRGASAVAAGDLDTRIEIETPDEFGALAGEFNAMTVALKRNQERLAESERHAGIGRLAAGVAHELNNPLQVMLAYLSLNRDLPDPRRARQLAAVEEEIVHCKEIIDGLLELARPSVQPVHVDLLAVCRDVTGILGVTSPAARVHLVPAGEVVTLGDPPKLRQVVFNLVKNAVQAAGPGGSVHVRVAATGGRAEVAVQDDGPGVSPEVMERLFEPFFTTKPAGTGLGLAVSRAIALAHGGDIEVCNGSTGGAVFTMRLPRGPERESRDEATPHPAGGRPPRSPACTGERAGG